MLKDGAFHAVDSSELAFRLATIGAFREAFKMAKGVILEPIMNVEVVAPVEFQSKNAHYISSPLSSPLATLGQVIGGLNTRRGTIVDSEVRDDEFTAAAEVALNDMFGYSNQLRGSTQGKGEFSMEYKVRPSLLVYYSSESSSPSITCLFCQIFKRILRRLTARPLLLKNRQYNIIP